MANERLVQGAFQPYYAGSSRATPLDVDLLLGPQKIYIGKVTVNGIGTDLRQRMLKALNDPPKAWFKAACAADDFKTYVPLVRGRCRCLNNFRLHAHGCMQPEVFRLTLGIVRVRTKSLGSPRWT